MPKLYNINIDEDIPKDAVYIGRGTPWGNPYIIGVDGTRKEVCELYELHLASVERFEALRGKDLVCHCTPKRCHGDVIMKYLYGSSLSSLKDVDEG